MEKSVSLLIIFVVFAVVLCETNDEATQFHRWMLEHGKVYESNVEYLTRLSIFTSTLRKINTHNSREDVTWQQGLNEYSDLTWEEFSSRFLTVPQDCSATASGSHSGNKLTAPDYVDWRTTGIVTPVKNQGSCGSCWAFSTIGAVEAHYAKTYGSQLIFSEQQLVDCASAFNNFGCDGGLPSQAFEYIHYNGGIELLNDYPYTAKTGTCQFNKAKIATTVKDVFNITELDEVAMQNSVAKVGPISFCYQVTNDFQSYKSGVYSNPKCGQTSDDVNHAVLAVGYATNTTVPYWIVKNSWGTTWGLQGYFNIRLGNNECGLATCSSYPIL